MRSSNLLINSAATANAFLNATTPSYGNYGNFAMNGYLSVVSAGTAVANVVPGNTYFSIPSDNAKGFYSNAYNLGFGIQTQNPSYTLDVNGDINGSGSLLTINSTAANGILRFTTQGGNSYIQWGSNFANTSYGPLYFTNPLVGKYFMALNPIGYGAAGTTSNFAQTFYCSYGAANSNNFTHYYTSGASGANSSGLYANHYQLFTYPAGGGAVSVWDINSNGIINFTTNVGIGYGVNTTPASPLDVNGTIRGINYMTSTGVTYCPNSAITQLYTINYPNQIYVVEWSMRNSNGYANIVGGGFVSNNSYVVTLYSYTGSPYIAFINGSTGGIAFGNNTGGSFNVTWSVIIRVLI